MAFLRRNADRSRAKSTRLSKRVFSLQQLESRWAMDGSGIEVSDFLESPAIPAAASSAQALEASSLALRVRDSYLPGLPLLVQIELRGDDGEQLRELWDANVSLVSDTPGVTVSVIEVRLRNGFGSALVNVTGNTSFTLRAEYGNLSTTRTLTSLAGVPQTNVSGTLPGFATTWSGVVRVTNDVIVPVGHTLTINPGTLVLVDGDGIARSELGKDIEVRGRLNAVGTAAQPITFTATGSTQFWGEIRHVSSQSSAYAHVEITKAGHSPRGGHTNTGPAIRPTNSTLDFNYVAITDTAGKTMTGNGSTLNLRHTHFARSVMGPEVDNTAVLFEDSDVHDMLGIYQENGGAPDDNDGFYIHSQSAGQTVRFVDSVFSRGDDDGIDTLGASITVEDSIVRDYSGGADPDSKGISLLAAESTIRRTLIVNNNIGISAKVQGEPSATVHLDHVTIADANIGIEANDKNNRPDALINYNVTNSIIQANQTVRTDYPISQIVIRYSNLSHAWAGVGNVVGDPQFVDPAANDYHLRFGSPAVDSGDPGFALDPDGTRTDKGYSPFTHSHIEARHIFYNGSKFDNLNLAADVNDDAAIAPDKQALLPGGTATFANYTNYLQGINGVIVDVADLAGTPTAGDFEFRIGNDNNPATWPLLATSPAISVRAGAGAGGSDRITFIWPNSAVSKTWLQVVVKPTANTGLASSDTFYFGNAVGEAGHSSISAQVTAIDEVFARNNPRSFTDPAEISFPYDYNRDGRVSALDQIIARNNRTTIINMLKLISVPAAGLAALEGQGLATAGSENSSDTKPMASPTLQPQAIALSEREPLAADNWDELSLPQATLWDIARSKRRTAASDNMPSVE